MADLDEVRSRMGHIVADPKFDPWSGSLILEILPLVDSAVDMMRSEVDMKVQVNLLCPGPSYKNLCA